MTTPAPSEDKGSGAGGGCGCSTSTPTSWLAALVGVATLRRRRRAGVRRREGRERKLGRVELSAHLGAPYVKQVHGPRLFRALDVEATSARSRSFRRLLAVLGR